MSRQLREVTPSPGSGSELQISFRDALLHGLTEQHAQGRLFLAGESPVFKTWGTEGKTSTFIVSPIGRGLYTEGQLDGFQSEVARGTNPDIYVSPGHDYDRSLVYGALGFTREAYQGKPTWILIVPEASLATLILDYQIARYKDLTVSSDMLDLLQHGLIGDQLILMKADPVAYTQVLRQTYLQTA